MLCFMAMGNIRLGEAGIDIVVPPTDSQKVLIRRLCFLYHGRIYVDFRSGSGENIGYKEYEAGAVATDIIDDIVRFFDK